MSVDLNELWMRLSKAFGASGMQAPLLPQSRKHSLGMKIGTGNFEVENGGLGGFWTVLAPCIDL